jgi:hypothetical protein
MMQTGFPDFIAFKPLPEVGDEMDGLYDIKFIECKVNGYLTKEEKEKAQWYLKNNYCSKFLVAYKTKIKNKVKVNYKEIKLE